MKLLLTVPSGVLVDESVVKIAAESDFGAFVMLPHHADTAVLLVPGLLSYYLTDGREVFVAVDQGVLVKAGDQVRAACQRAVVTVDLANAQEMVRERFQVQSEREKRARTALIRLEADILKRVGELRR